MTQTDEQRRAYAREWARKKRATDPAYRARDRARSAASYAANREERLRKAREYYAANSDKVLAGNQESRTRNRAQRNATDGKWRVANRTEIRANFAQWTHGLRPDDWAAMWQAQDGRCYLCGDALVKGKVHVDHDHSHCAANRSCRICQRGLACHNCNCSIGFARDDAARLRRMADALEAAQMAVDQRRAAAGEQLTL